jgi:hypothetical protein
LSEAAKAKSVVDTPSKSIFTDQPFDIIQKSESKTPPNDSKCPSNSAPCAQPAKTDDNTKVAASIMDAVAEISKRTEEQMQKLEARSLQAAVQMKDQLADAEARHKAALAAVKTAKLAPTDEKHAKKQKAAKNGFLPPDEFRAKQAKLRDDVMLLQKQVWNELDPAVQLAYSDLNSWPAKMALLQTRRLNRQSPSTAVNAAPDSKSVERSGGDGTPAKSAERKA